MLKRYWPALLIASLVLSLALPLLWGGMRSASMLARLPLWAMVVLPGMVMVAWGFNAVRVRLLARELGHVIPRWTVFRYVAAAEFAGMATPAHAGWPATYIYLLGRRGMSTPSATALVALDQMFDLAFFATAIPAVLLASLDLIGARFWPLALVFPVAGLGVLFVVPRYYRPVLLWAGRVLRHLGALRRLRWRFARWLLKFRASVRLILRMPRRRLVTVYLACAAHWLLRYGVLPVVFWVLGEPVSWAYLFLVQGLTLFAGQITMLPGGAGGVEVGFGVLLGPYVGAETLAAALLVWRFCTFHWYLIAGAPFFLVSIGRWRIGGRRAA